MNGKSFEVVLFAGLFEKSDGIGKKRLMEWVTEKNRKEGGPTVRLCTTMGRHERCLSHAHGALRRQRGTNDVREFGAKEEQNDDVERACEREGGRLC